MRRLPDPLAAAPRLKRGKCIAVGVLLALAMPLASAQADLGPRTPVEGGAIIMPEHAPPRQEPRKPEVPRAAPSPDRKQTGHPQPAGKRSRQDDCRGSAAQCRQHSAR